jgi:ubiquinone/menaquinone biosynthesis C-methylase UbiE
MSPSETDAIHQQQRRAEKLAEIYDREILPLWSQPFGRHLLSGLEIPLRSNVLDVACGTGYPTLDLLPRLDPKSRIIGLDVSHEMLKIAREKAGELAGKRVFFKHGRIEDLNFASETFDLVVSNCGVLEFGDRRQGIREMARVAKRGALLAVTLPLRGTFCEFYDLYREVLQRFELDEVIARLDDHVSATPDPAEAVDLFEQAGLSDVALERHEFMLLFPSGREFFFTPLIEYGYLQGWKEIVGRSETMQRVFWHIKNAIDLYFARRPFTVTVSAACLKGRRY